MKQFIWSSRFLSWVTALLVGAWLAWALQPLTPATLLNQVRALQVDHADLYSALHEQPFAYCNSYLEQRAQALAAVESLGLFYMDEMFAWAISQDPILRYGVTNRVALG